jgi:hypothetical protein
MDFMLGNVLDWRVRIKWIQSKLYWKFYKASSPISHGRYPKLGGKSWHKAAFVPSADFLWRVNYGGFPCLGKHRVHVVSEDMGSHFVRPWKCAKKNCGFHSLPPHNPLPPPYTPPPHIPHLGWCAEATLCNVWVGFNNSEIDGCLARTAARVGPGLHLLGPVGLVPF